VLLVNALISILFSGNVHDIYVSISTQDQEERRYRRLFSLMSTMAATTDKLQSLLRDATERGGGAIQGFRALGRIVWLTNTNLSSLKFLVHIFLQTTLLWDFHVLTLLERWQRRYGPHAGAWFRALGELEALASFALAAHDHPDWCFPTIDETATTLSAKAMGHALLADRVCVVNDVEVGPQGTFLLVTGSNMSGKSTLLRSIGTNVVLAQAGSPVCATSLRMPPVILETSMRIRDSLENGVSFYMAELRRLKQIVDQAEALTERADRRLLYLLDEILQGTNSRERHLAVVRVISHLRACGAIGAVSTHDLELAAAPLDHVCRPVHFRETLHDRDDEKPMTFDYKLRPGVATTSNALKLLEIVGLVKKPI
jgi:DNA mismatch repair ATPase MutS